MRKLRDGLHGEVVLILLRLPLLLVLLLEYAAVGVDVVAAGDGGLWCFFCVEACRRARQQHQPHAAGLKERKVTDGCDQLIDKLLNQEAHVHPIWYSVQSKNGIA